MKPASEQRSNTPDNLYRFLAPIVRSGSLSIFLVFGVVGGWMAYAPLSSAAIAIGVVNPDSSRKSVQHLEGGIVKEILVKDGDAVASGQPLIRLEDTQARAAYQSLQAQWLRMRAIKERAVALQLDKRTLEFSPDIVAEAKEGTDLAAFLKAQLELFETRRAGIEGRRMVLARQSQQLREQIVGLKAELAGNTEQLALVDEELVGLNMLLKDGNALKSRVLQMQRARAEISSKVAASSASIESAGQKLLEIELTVNNAETEYRDKLADEVMRVNGELAQTEEKLLAARDVLARTVVAAPVSGVIVGLRVKTTGGVIRSGDVLLQLVPANDELVIDARVQPIDIKSVHPGQLAQVNLLPYQQRNLPIIEGRVTNVSADAMTEERTGERYYEVKIVVARDHLKEIAPEVELTPGMPADVLIVTGERSALRYIFEPIERSFRMSFRQS